MFPAVHETVHRGIPVFWADSPGPFAGTLTFGVGVRDEPVTQLGVTHLLEHLVFRACEPLLVQNNGYVDDRVITFFARGGSDEVVDFLNRIAAAVHTVGTDSAAIDRELAIIEAENPQTYRCAGTSTLTHRFGLGGLGNSGAHPVTVSSLTGAEVSAWALARLTTANAVLAFSGPVPDGLAINLPTGEEPARYVPQPVIATPCLVATARSGVALSMVLPSPCSPLFDDALEFDLRRRLRHELGLVYSISTHRTRISPAEQQLDLGLDPLDASLEATVREATNLLRRIASDGFSADAIAAADTTFRAGMAWRRTFADADEAATNHVTRHRVQTSADLLADADATTSESLRLLLAGALDSLIIAVPGGEEEEALGRAAGLPLETDLGWMRTEPTRSKDRSAPTWKGARKGHAAGAVLELSDDRLSVWHDESTHVVLGDVVLVGHRRCGCVELIDQRGRNARMDPEDWKDGSGAVEAVLARFDAALVRRMPAHG